MFLALVLVLPASAPAAPVPLAQVGSSGSGAGQLSSPERVALDGAGNLYVADSGNNRISVFDANGTFIHAFGWNVDPTGGGGSFEVCTMASTCQAGGGGGGDGDLNYPFGLAFDGAGNLYVADTLNYRISVFDTAGPSFIRAFGGDVANPPDAGTTFEVCPDDGLCRAGELGGGAGEFWAPPDVGLDGAGNLYVVDTGNNRISVFDTAGPSFTHSFGWDVATGGGAAFEVCPTDGACQMGTGGGGGGQLNTPYGLALDGAGGLYVADPNNGRIDVFDTAVPSFTRAFGWDVAALDGDLAFEVCPTDGACRTGDGGGGAGQLSGPFDVALDGAGGLYVADAYNNRISVFDTAGPSFTRAFGWDVAGPDGDLAFELCPTQGACQSGDSGAGFGQLNGPQGVATDTSGAVWVADTSNDRLQRFGEPVAGGAGGGGAGAAAPSNAFTIGKLKGKTLKLNVSSLGTAEVTDAGASGASARAAAKRLLKTSTATGGPGTIAVTLKLTKAASQKLGQRGKVTVNARITFTPNGGTTNSRTQKLKIKKR